MNTFAPMRLGVAYGLAGFAVGFALGVARTLLVAPLIGSFAAVTLEIPLMLVAGGFIARPILRRAGAISVGQGIGLGAAAFVVVMLCEVALSRLLGINFLAGFAKPEGIVGLCGQAVFCLLPSFMRSPAA